MLITLITETKICSLQLPKYCTGKYGMCDKDILAEDNKILEIEADEFLQKWKLLITKSVHVNTNKENDNKKELFLEENKMYSLMIGKSNLQKAYLLVEEFNEGCTAFTKYMVANDITMNIGRASENHIVLKNPFVSSYHASIQKKNGKWLLYAKPDTNGVYINKQRAKETVELRIGDVIFIVGFKIVIGKDFIAFNNPQNNLVINDRNLVRYQKNNDCDNNTLELSEASYFYRSPRFSRTITPLELKIDSPTQKMYGDDMPLILSIAPSLVMGAASLSTGVISTINSFNTNGNLTAALPTMIMSASMLGSMVMLPLITKNYTKKRKILKEEERQEKYLKYLEILRKEIERNIQYQEEILRDNNPFILNLVKDDEFWEQKLWSKAAEQPDFLYIRFGIGNELLQATLKFPEDRFAIDDDLLRDKLIEFQREKRFLQNVPVGVSLIQNKIIGIVGKKADCYNLIHNIILQTVSLHSYDEVKIVFVGNRLDNQELRYIKYVPHIWDDEKKHRYYATSEDDIRDLNNEMFSIIQKRKEKRTELIPHYLILVTDKENMNKCSFITNVLEAKDNIGFSVIAAFDKVASLPKECSMIAELSDNRGILVQTDNTNKEKIGFVQDAIGKEYTEKYAIKTSCYQLDLQQGRYTLPGMLTFMDMFGVGKYEHLNIRQRWTNSNPVLSLRAPVGVDTQGKTFYLDLHEKYHGPHGLIAGMTGSGKSEFIITYILSMAINYHPNEVAFVLIDYKGGGLTGAFENENYRLPHLAGTITNLDGGSITRAILSIKSELRRRQAKFNEARIIANEGTMDIYKYQKMFREGLVSEPMPHLFIISDEFAELKAQHMEFMDQLISTARIGRSLGVHLILATQKPNGVVNDQIWANSRFKVCLKVQDKADSMDMLKREEAAELADTGRFYLQVGYNEIFEMGQSAWSGAVYTDTNVIEKEVDSCIEVIDNLGNTIDKIKARKETKETGHGKQIVRILEHLNEIALTDHISERQLWLPVMQEYMLLDDIEKRYQYRNTHMDELCALVGEYDNPYQQSKDVLEINFTQGGNAILYGAAGSGDEAFLNALLYSLLKSYTCEQVNIYALDFGSESLNMFDKAPHVGGVVKDGENEKIEKLFMLLNDEINTRKKILSAYGGDILKYKRENKDSFAYILVMINNYSHFSESYENYEDKLISLTREGSKYGIYFLLTASAITSVRYRLGQNFKQLYVLQLNDKTDYVSILGSTNGVFPPKIKARGIFKTDETYVFQTGYLVGPDDSLIDFVKQFCEYLDRKSDGLRKPQIPVMPDFISGSEISYSDVTLNNVPLGVFYKNNMFAVHNFEEQGILQILSNKPSNAFYYSGGLIETVSQVPDIHIMIFGGNEELKYTISADYEYVRDDYDNKVQELFQEIKLRNNEYKSNNGKTDLNMYPILVVIHSMAELKKHLSKDGYDMITTGLLRQESFWNIFFIVCDTNQLSESYAREEWYIKRLGLNGIWVGNGIADQRRLSIYDNKKKLEREVEDTIGFLVEDGKAMEMRLIMPDSLKEVKGNE